MPVTDVQNLVDACADRLAAKVSNGFAASPAFPLLCSFLGFRNCDCAKDVTHALAACWRMAPEEVPMLADADYAPKSAQELLWNICQGKTQLHFESTSNRALLAYFIDLACDDEVFGSIAECLAPETLPQILGVSCKPIIFAFRHAGADEEADRRCGRHFARIVDIRANNPGLTIVCFGDRNARRGVLGRSVVHENFQAAASLLFIANRTKNEGIELRQKLLAGGILCVSYRMHGFDRRIKVAECLTSILSSWLEEDAGKKKDIGYGTIASRLDEDGWADFLLKQWDEVSSTSVPNESETLFTVPYTSEVAALDACFEAKRGLFGFARTPDCGEKRELTNQAALSLHSVGEDGDVWGLMLERLYCMPVAILLESRDGCKASAFENALAAVLRSKFSLSEMSSLFPGETSEACLSALGNELQTKIQSRYLNRLSACSDLGACLNARALFDLESMYVSKGLTDTFVRMLQSLARDAGTLSEELKLVSNELQKSTGNYRMAGRPDIKSPAGRMPEDLSAENLATRLADALDSVASASEGLSSPTEDGRPVQASLSNWDYRDDIRLLLKTDPTNASCPDAACVLQGTGLSADSKVIASPWRDRVECLAVLPVDPQDIRW